ncbi:hypothetical protein K501DRAFT_274580 [Backusella circina FSU 941]|nr:hypothetical protein K501DRAFT_274580 [Backusella circina FSU 941]
MISIMIEGKFWLFYELLTDLVCLRKHMVASKENCTTNWFVSALGWGGVLKLRKSWSLPFWNLGEPYQPCLEEWEDTISRNKQKSCFLFVVTFYVIFLPTLPIVILDTVNIESFG